MAFFKTLLTVATALSTVGVIAAPVPGQHQHHAHERRDDGKSSSSGTCSFPNDMGAVKLSSNKAGWAQDGECKPGHYCQYACPPGQLMGQWNPKVTSYSYPGSQEGGVYCNDDGNIEKPISKNDYCYDGVGTASAKNSAGGSVAFCQTVLPGNEAMLIPTEVGAGSSEKLAVPGTDYWASTASHFYVNPPGVSAEEGCVWGSTSKPYGNWSPYVAGFNMDDSGSTFAKIGWNPVYFEDASPFKDTKPEFGIKMYCNDKSKCNGDPCEINPKKVGLNKVSAGNNKSDGAAWCIVTATDKSAVTIEVFDL